MSSVAVIIISVVVLAGILMDSFGFLGSHVPGDKRPFLRSSKWDRSCSHQNSVLGVGIHIRAIL